MKIYPSLFKHYDDPKKAKKIWEDYSEDMPEEFLDVALEIIGECNTSHDLDVKLDLLCGGPYTLMHFVGNNVPSLNDCDEDYPSFYTIARKTYEEDLRERY